MNPALWISKTGLDAQQTNISVTSNNLANASTVGFKKSRAIFEDLLYQNINQPGGRSSADTELPSGLMLGAGGKSKSEIEQTVDFLGASLRTGSSLEGSMVQANFMAKDSHIMLPLLKTVVMQPDFPAAEFTKLQQREVAARIQVKESPREVIDQYFHRLVFKNHPYGKTQLGDADSVKGIALADIKAFHRSYYQPGNAAVIVAGDFKPEQMKQQLQQLFAGWKNTSAPGTASSDLSTHRSNLEWNVR